jgi:hypothetical protein
MIELPGAVRVDALADLADSGDQGRQGVPLADGPGMAFMPEMGTNVPARNDSGSTTAKPIPCMASELR